MGENKPLTRNQVLVSDVLARAKKPLSAYDILDELRDEGLRAPLQIYRALKHLTNTGLAHRLESLNAFVACMGQNCQRAGMTGFFICTSCEKAEEFSDLELRNHLSAVTESHNFNASHSVVEIKGVCAKCAET